MAKILTQRVESHKGGTIKDAGRGDCPFISDYACKSKDKGKKPCCKDRDYQSCGNYQEIMEIPT